MLRNIFFHSASAALLTTLIAANSAYAATTGIKITEWMYNPVNSPGEFVELTNFGPAAVDFTGWSYDDNSRTAGSDSLSSLGIVQAGESVILTEASAGDFRSAWSLSNAVNVVGGITNNLGRSDEINLYDATSALVDRLTFNDQGTGSVKGPGTKGVSGNPGSISAIGANNASAWTLSTVGDTQGSYASLAIGSLTGGDIGNPGKSSYAPAVPLPAALPLWMSAMSLMGVVGRLRRRR